MTAIVETAPAKINLALHVRRRRDDGYHELETLFAFCRDGDVVTVERADSNSLTLTGPFAGVLAGEAQDDNLVMRAARGFLCAVRGERRACHRPRQASARRVGHRRRLGGCGGDLARTGAAARRGDRRLRAVRAGGGAGADVPACLLGQTARGEGKGDALQPLEPLGGRPVLLVNPGVGVSTAAVFGAGTAWTGARWGRVM